MKKTIYISSGDKSFNYPNAHQTLEDALKFSPQRIVKVYVEIPVELDEAVAVEEPIN